MYVWCFIVDLTSPPFVHILGITLLGHVSILCCVLAFPMSVMDVLYLVVAGPVFVLFAISTSTLYMCNSSHKFQREREKREAGVGRR